MQFDPPLIEARLVRRYKRFLADVEIEGQGVVVAHCPNPGRMTGLDEADARVWLSRSGRLDRKLAYTLEYVEANAQMTGVNTHRANALAREALALGRIEALRAYDEVQSEVAYHEKSRVDFRLSASGAPTLWLEVKSVTLSRQSGLAEFPDTPSERAVRHVEALSAMIANGDRAAILFVVQRSDCRDFRLASDIDPSFARAIASARKRGLEIYALSVAASPERAEIGPTLHVAASDEVGSLSESARL